jgi:acetyl-CoA C-acetyltransferase
MPDVVVIDAVRTPVGRRDGGLAQTLPVDLLGAALTALVERTGIDAGVVGQVVTGCVTQVGEQSFNVGRTAWLAAGLPQSVPATTVDSQCGSSQQAANLAASLVTSGAVDMAVACGVESMSRVAIGSNSTKGSRPITKSYFAHYEFTSQFEGAERIADKWGITREDADRLGLRSQQLASRAWAEDRFGAQVVPVAGVARDEGLRDTSPDKLATLKPVARPDGVHTAGTSSQISDGAAAMLFSTEKRASSLGLTPRARVVDHCLVGVDPVLMLTGPMEATGRLLGRSGWGIDDIDVFEINEAFAAVVLAWQKECGPDPDRVNPNGGAIALGHPLGATGVILLTKALYELERAGTHRALVSMCCGGGLGTGTLLER